ncbi:MAG: ABC transporter permease, partial [Burkholderiaceae bacterium]
MSNPIALISRLGAGFIAMLGGIGMFTRFFGQLLTRSSIVLRRPRLVSQQVHFIG